MANDYAVTGTIHSIDETREYGSNGFTKREFVIKLTGEGENSAYPNHIALELIKDKCSLIDQFAIGDEIKVRFNLSGRLWSGGNKGEKCFNSLQAWRLEAVAAGVKDDQSLPPAQLSEHSDGGFDDIPF